MLALGGNQEEKPEVAGRHNRRGKKGVELLALTG
jgi:hypothetical protein